MLQTNDVDQVLCYICSWRACALCVLLSPKPALVWVAATRVYL